MNIATFSLKSYIAQCHEFNFLEKKSTVASLIKLDAENKHQCNLCGLLYSQNISRGYTNLKNHLDICHSSDWNDVMKKIVGDGKGTIDHFLTASCSDKAITIHSLLKWSD